MKINVTVQVELSDVDNMLEALSMEGDLLIGLQNDVYEEKREFISGDNNPLTNVDFREYLSDTYGDTEIEGHNFEPDEILENAGMFDEAYDEWRREYDYSEFDEYNRMEQRIAHLDYLQTILAAFYDSLKATKGE